MASASFLADDIMVPHALRFVRLGLDFESLDLKDNFFAAGSHDFNDNTELPRPILDDDVHGTRCAGEIAAVRDNNVCGVGVAYNARVSGIRILSKDITDADEAMALNYRYHDNHIMSCSWGPPDDGASADAPQGIIAKAVVNGVTNGRNGKGTIYVFATGNGGLYQDNCNFDGYTNSVYTLTIGAIDILNRHPYYSEACSAQIAVTYSSGAGHFIFTTDVGSEKCAANHGGTSAAAPLAAGLLALVLDVRPDLNWRDVQHICIRTAEIVSADDEDWKPTYAGRKFNHKFGYGRLDAYRMVTFARTWKSVKPQTRLQMPPVHLNATIPFGPDGLQSNVTVTHEMVASAGLERLEHVTVTVNLNHSLRGDVEIMLVSPN
ncbi:MAG: peptidase S8/S53 domain-containing protein, partial [Olpidium bornovanus]